ncbi:MAG: hypothetical protein FJX72_13445 [Armatimonadetes bacterium]|nr:hypothetical protein [Armatimonadota bacterium]
MRQLPTAPSPRAGAGMSFDGLRMRVVLHGGVAQFGAFLGDTWEYDGTAWSVRTLAQPLAPRADHGMVFDLHRNRIVVFGGCNATGATDETWEYDGANWTQKVTVTPPPARYAHGMAFENNSGKTVIFGGTSIGIFQSLADTWQWDGNAWTQVQTTTTPPGRSDGRLVFPGSRGVLLFGGVSITAPFFYQDLWQLQGSNWVAIPAAAGPSGRGKAGFVFDGNRSVCVLFGGGAGSQASLSDTWELSGVGATAWASAYGLGCPGSNGVPVIAAGNRPVMGSSFQIDGSNMPTYASQLAIGYFGLSRQSWGPIPLPFDLAMFGMPGCLMHASPPPPGEIHGTMTNNGSCRWVYNVPLHSVFLGASVFFQALVPDSQAGNTLGATVTNGLEASIGW